MKEKNERNKTLPLMALAMKDVSVLMLRQLVHFYDNRRKTPVQLCLLKKQRKREK